MANPTAKIEPTKFVPRQVLRRFVDSFEDLLESLEYANPKFWKEIEASRKSGVVSAKAIERRLGIK